jgi:hypothetical protein
MMDLKKEKKERPVLVDMEKDLLNDKSGVYRKELINKLLRYDSEVSVELSSASDDSDLFNRIGKLKEAIRCAKYTVEKF